MANDKRTSLFALARTFIPGGSNIPAPQAAIADEADAWVQHLAPALGPAWRWFHGALDVAAMLASGKHFADLSDETRTRLVTNWQASGPLRRPLDFAATIYKVVHFDTPLVQAAMGARLRTPAKTLDRPRWLERVHRASDWHDGDIECDVVVIGTGAGGAVAGRHLAERGHAVVFVERGEHLRRDAFDGSAVRAHSRFLRTACALGEAVIPIFSGDLVGGSTAVNGGTCFRTPPWILDRWCEELGTA